MTKTIYHGWLAGSTDAVRMPNISYQNGYLKAMTDNSGNCFLGSSSDVGIAGTSDTNTTTGYVLDASEVIVLGAPGNLDEMWYICDNAGDDLIYYVEMF